MPKYSRDDLIAIREAGASQTDLEAVRAKSEAQIAADIASDPDFDGMSPDWFEDAEVVLPAAKRLTSLRLDPAVLDWFRSQGPGYQTRINAVLANYVRHKQLQSKR